VEVEELVLVLAVDFELKRNDRIQKEILVFQ
jgi:hypothetical protein